MKLNNKKLLIESRRVRNKTFIVDQNYGAYLWSGRNWTIDQWLVVQCTSYWGNPQLTFCSKATKPYMLSWRLSKAIIQMSLSCPCTGGTDNLREVNAPNTVRAKQIFLPDPTAKLFSFYAMHRTPKSHEMLMFVSKKTSNNIRPKTSQNSIVRSMTQWVQPSFAEFYSGVLWHKIIVWCLYEGK